MDIPRLKGKPWLEPAEAVQVADLEAWEKQAGVQVGSGDAVLLHTGRWIRRAEKGPHEGGYPGFHASVVPWFKERDVAVVGTDGGLDVYPSGIDGVGAPVHTLVLTALGMPILDVMDPDRRRRRCRRAQTLDLPVDRRAAACRDGYRFADQLDRDILTFPACAAGRFNPCPPRSWATG